MALDVLNFQDRVLYSCSCSQLSTLGDLFFCRHCKLPRCQDCVSSTIESFSCPHCFEAAMSDLKAKKGRCSRCFQCPQCFTTLSTRSVIVPLEVLGDQTPPPKNKSESDLASKGTPTRALPSMKSPGGTKVYYLSCSHCKWSSRDVGIKDKRSPIDFKDRESPHQSRIISLINFYKEYATQDHAGREKAKKIPSGRRQRSYGSLLDPSKFTSKTVTGSESPGTRRSSQLVWSKAKVEGMAAVAGEPEPPSEDLYEKELNLEEMPSLRQQLQDPVYQPQNNADLWPCQLRLTGKKLHRCKGCDHILMKAEMNLSSIRFKIQQAAIHSFPQIRIAESPGLKVGVEAEVILSITNPLNYAVTVTFQQCPEKQLSRIKESLTPVILPEGEFHLTPNDDVVDLLEGESESEIKDDPQYVLQRLPGKVFLKFHVTPEVSTEAVRVAFSMQFGHKSTVEADKENELCVVMVPILVRLNKPST